MSTKVASLFGERAIELAALAAEALCWRPADFWSSTPAELTTSLGLEQRASDVMVRVELERLQAAFPDYRGQ